MTRPAQRFRAIGCADDLRKAVGECASEDARRYVLRRARALGRMDLVPAEWRRQPPAAAGAPDGPLRVLEQKLAQHNSAAPPDRRTTLPRLKAVYRRGMDAYTTTPRPGVTCDQFAQTRVTSFLHLLRTGQSRSLSAIDRDLLPRTHPLAEFTETNPVFDALHPRGRDGKFIEKGGLVHVLDAGGRVIGTGKVGDIKDADHISVTTSDGTVVAKAQNIEQVHSVATLHPGAAVPTASTSRPDPSVLASANWKGLVSRSTKDSGVKLGVGVNDSFFASGPDGHNYFVKADSSVDNGVSNEIDAANFFKPAFAGTPRIAPNTTDRTVLISTIAGSDVPGLVNEGSLTDLADANEPDLQWLNLADPSSALRLRLHDLVIGNEDRHSGNLMLGRQQDGKYQFLPIDHGIAFAPEADIPYTLGQWNVAGKAAKEYVTQVGRDQAMNEAQKMITEMESAINSMTFSRPRNLETVMKNIDYLQKNLEEIMNKLEMYIPEGE